MTENKFLELVTAGALLCRGEYRLSKVDLLHWRDKATGKPMDAVILRHTVEVGSQSLAVNERVPDGVKWEDVKIPFVKGDTVVLFLEELLNAKGLVSCRGRLEILDASNRPGVPIPVASGKNVVSR